MPDSNALNLNILQIGLPFCREKTKKHFPQFWVCRESWLYSSYSPPASIIYRYIQSLLTRRLESCCHCSITSCIKRHRLAQHQPLSKLDHKYAVLMLKLTEMNKEPAKRSQRYNCFLFTVRLYLAPVSFACNAEGYFSWPFIKADPVLPRSYQCVIPCAAPLKHMELASAKCNLPFKTVLQSCLDLTPNVIFLRSF